MGKEKALGTWKNKVFGNIGFMSFVNVHLHYLAVLGAQRNRSKASPLHCRESFAFQEGKLSLCLSHHRKKLLIIYSHRYALFCATHTHTPKHTSSALQQAARILIKTFAINESLLHAQRGNGSAVCSQAPKLEHRCTNIGINTCIPTKRSQNDLMTFS